MDYERDRGPVLGLVEHPQIPFLVCSYLRKPGITNQSALRRSAALARPGMRSAWMLCKARRRGGFCRAFWWNAFCLRVGDNSENKRGDPSALFRTSARWSGRTKARTGLRMMPTFPSSPLRFRKAGLPGRRGGYPPRPPQTRTSAIHASGSSRERFVPSGIAVDDPGCWQCVAVEERVEAVPCERLSSRSAGEPLVPDLRDLVAIVL
jgi:hypothetical protein